MASVCWDVFSVAHSFWQKELDCSTPSRHRVCNVHGEWIVRSTRFSFMQESARVGADPFGGSEWQWSQCGLLLRRTNQCCAPFGCRVYTSRAVIMNVTAFSRTLVRSDARVVRSLVGMRVLRRYGGDEVAGVRSGIRYAVPTSPLGKATMCF